MRIRVDSARPLAEQPETGHNRWHPDIEPVASVRPGAAVTLETRDGIDGQLAPGSAREDVLALDLGRGHPLTGPLAIDGARPGDLLEVQILAVEPAATGVTAIFPGFGLLPDDFREPFVAVWTIDSERARSEELPGVAIPCAPFPGVVGVAPSHERMAAIRRREDELRARGGPVADDLPASAVPEHAAGGLRTIPPRETGGNLDARQLVAGSRLFLPVDVPRALFSVGDLHAAQGDGEVCGFGVEVAGAITVRFALHRGQGGRLRFPSFESPGLPERRSFVTTGMPVGLDGRNEAMDLTLAAQNALREMISHLGATRGLSPEQAYVLASAAVDLRVAEAVDVPNPLVSAALPLDIFEA